MERARQLRISPAEISTEKARRCEVSTPRTDALRTRLAPLADTLSVDNFGEVTVRCIAESLALCAALERELAEVIAERDAARAALDIALVQ